MAAETYRVGRKQPHQTIYIEVQSGNPEDDRMVAVALESQWGPHLVERLNAGAQTVEALRLATERAEVAETNFKAAENELVALVAAAGFDTTDGGPMLEDVEERVVQLVTLAQRLVRLDGHADPAFAAGAAHVERRRAAALTDLIKQTRSALGIQEGGNDE